MNTLKYLLHTGGHSCVIRRDHAISTYDGKGIRDLLMLLESESLTKAQVADKVVGKAAASIMAAGGVSEVYADVMSRTGAGLLESSGIAYSYGELTDYIKRADGQGLCPMEQLTLDATSAEEAVNRIKERILGKTSHHNQTTV